MRLTRNVPIGLALGVATAGVILALGGCVTHGTSAGSSSAPSVSASPTSAETFDAFSDSERERILAVQDIVERAAAEHELDPTLINAMIWVESRFDPHAKSSAGARGLMQLMPATAAYLAKRMGERSARAYDPEFNVRAGSLYLAEMMKTFGDETHAVAAYHAGPGNVKRWLESGEAFPDYSQIYVAKVMDARVRFEGTPVHGRPRGSSAPIIETTIEAEAEAEFEPEPLEVPDVDTLPDAAEIHGVPRVIYERSEPAPAPKPEPEPEPEPVFIVHPELDRNPDAAPRGWSIPGASGDPEPEPTPEPEPKPKPKPKPEADPGEEAGLGVLPDL